MEKTIDVAVVGAGVAGLSAALFFARAGKSTVVFDGGKQRIFAVDTVREFAGFDGISPAKMLARIQGEATRYGAEVRRAFVDRVDPRADGAFDVFSGGIVTTARAVVLATGLIDEVPRLPGVSEVWGRDLGICPCFDGYEVRGKRFVVFGLPARLKQFASWVSIWSNDVTVVSPTPLGEEAAGELKALGIAIVQDEVTGVLHDNGNVAGVSTATGRTIACEAVWISAASRAASGLAASLCDVDALGFAKTDADGRTSRPGVFAIGNASNPVAHLAHAAAAGTNVGPIVALYLLNTWRAAAPAGNGVSVYHGTAPSSL